MIWFRDNYKKELKRTNTTYKSIRFGEMTFRFATARLKITTKYKKILTLYYLAAAFKPLFLMKNNTLFRLLLSFSILLALVAIGSYVAQQTALTGTAAVGFFVTLAVAFRYNAQLKGFSYTIWIFAAVTAAMFYPQYFRQVGDFQLKALIIPLIQIIMFGMGSQMSLQDFAAVMQSPKSVLIGVLSQFIIMPTLGFTLANVFDFPPEIAAGVVLIGCSPSGLASNVMAFIAKANVTLSVTITSITTLLAPFLTPALMKLLAGSLIEVDFWKMMLEIAKMILLPIIAGLIFNRMAYARGGKTSPWMPMIGYLAVIYLKNYVAQVADPAHDFASGILIDGAIFMILPAIGGALFGWLAKGNKEWLDAALSLISMTGIALIITIITATGRDSLLNIGGLLIVSCLIHNIFGYTLGYWSGRVFGLDEQSCRTVAIEVGMQNGGLASGIALQMGKVATVGLAPAVFGPMMNITASVLASFWRTRPPKSTDVGV